MIRKHAGRNRRGIVRFAVGVPLTFLLAGCGTATPPPPQLDDYTIHGLDRSAQEACINESYPRAFGRPLEGWHVTGTTPLTDGDWFGVKSLHPSVRGIARAENKLFGTRIVKRDDLRFVVLTFSKQADLAKANGNFSACLN